MVKRVVLITVLVIVVVSGVWGLGAQEPDNALWFRVTDTSDNIIKQYDVTKGEEAGTIKLTIPVKDMGYAVVRESQGNEVKYLTTSENQIKDQQTIDQLEIIFRDNVRLEPSVYEVKNNFGHVTLAQYGNGTISLSTTLKNSLKSSKEKISLTIKDYYEEMGIEIIFINKTADKYEYLKTIVIPEFFKGEYELFANAEFNAYSYQQKVLAFMNTLINDTNFKQIMCDHVLEGVNSNDPFWNMFSKALTDKKITATQFNLCQNEFRVKFTEQFKINYDKVLYKQKEYQLPYLEFSKNTFSALYGGARNIYINAFMYFIYYKPRDDNSNQRGKPLISDIFEKSLKGTDIKYNYNDYTMLTEAEGEDLARYALRFFTGGVEYTPFPGTNIEKAGFSANRVFGTNFDLIKNWVTNNNNNKDRNYLPSSNFETVNDYQIIEENPAVPKQVQILEPAIRTDSITLKAKMKSNQQFKLGRIDIWTSKNIAWDPGVVQSVDVSGNGNPISNAQKAKIYDKRIVGGGGDEAGAKADNLHIERNGENNITVKYTFNTPQTVGAVLIVRGWCEETKGKTAPGTYDRLKIEDKVFEKGSTGITEYAGVPFETDWELEKIDSGAFGKSNWDAIYSRSNQSDKNTTNSHVVYSYYILDTPIENCSTIEFTDLFKNNNSNSELNIAEFMVFTDDPIKYLKDFGSNRYSFFNGTAAVYNVLKRANFSVPQNIANTEQIKINFWKTVDIDTVVLWEAPHNPATDSSIFAQRISLFYGPFANLISNDYYSNVDSYKEIVTALKDKLATPFINEKCYGNPLPYAPKGIDSPRTFAYKMYEQWRARMYFSYKNTSPGSNRILGRFPFIDFTKKKSFTTMAEDQTGFIDYIQGYVNEIDILRTVGSQFTLNQGDFVYNEAYNVIQGPKAGSIFNSTDFSQYMSADDTIKPFLPGFLAGNDTGFVAGRNSLYTPDKIAGVDSVGVLLGSLAMSSQSNNMVTALNAYVVSDVDNFYKMNKSDVVGLGDDNKPIYYGGENDSILNEVYKFNRSDLERSTVLVPDLAVAREGDLLVKYNEKGEPHIGIIVALGWRLNDTTPPPKGSDVQLYWDQVYVVSIRAGFQMVSIGKWGNTEMMLSGFTVAPEEYQIRRLLRKRRDFTIRPDDEIDDWELVRDPVDKLACRVHLPTNWDTEDPFDDTGTTNHWIPNTNEGLGPICITFEGKNKGGQVMSLQDAYDVVLLPPADQYFNSAQAAANVLLNINTNKGTGIQIWVEGIDTNGDPFLVDGEKSDFLLATFRRNDKSTIITYLRNNMAQLNLTQEFINNLETNDRLFEDYCYYPINDYIPYNTTYFESDGIANDDYRLCVENINVNVPELENVNYNSCLVFKVNSGMNDERIFYRFKIKVIQENMRSGDDFKLRFGISGSSAIAKTNDGDFIAVYDKNMLWRANLFLDERINRTDGKNSNIIDWNDINKWDVALAENPWNVDYDDMNNNGINTDKGNGGQISIKKFTWHNTDIIRNTNTNIFGAVCYSWYASQDSPIGYNKDMEDQKQAIRNSTLLWSIWPNTLAPSDTGNVNELNIWENYIENLDVNRPGHSSHGGANWNERNNTIGIDCGGLVYRALFYPGNQYAIPINWLDIRYWFDTGEVNGNLWEISRKPNQAGQQNVNLNKIIPGDILYMYNDVNSPNFTGYHVAIVQSVIYDPETRRTELGQIQLIEAIYDNDDGNGVPFGCIINFRNVNNYNNVNNWVVGRLK